LLYIPRFYDILNAKEAFIVKKFQKSLSLILLLSLVFSLAACGKKPDGPVPSSAPTTTPTQPTTPTTPVNPHIVVANTEGMTDLQKAIVVTAESYYLRGKYAQYDQYDLTKKSSAGIENVNRRLVGVKAPEDYTAQNYGYTDCSGEGCEYCCTCTDTTNYCLQWSG
jgi:predicted small lipoprotein YifL